MPGTLSAFLRDVIDKYDRQHPGGNEDMVRTPLETETAPSEDNTISPDQAMRDKEMGEDKRNITDDSGKIVDMDYGPESSKPYSTNPFAKAMGTMKPGGNGEGTLSGFISRLLSPTPERNNGGVVGGTGTVLRGDNLSPVPSKDQPQSELAPVPAPRLDPRRYSLSGLPVQQLDELRNSLLQDSGQNADPNSLAGRMSHPNAQSDMGLQGAEATNIADDIRGFNGRKPAAIKASRDSGQLEAGNVDLNNRPVVQNGDKVSTVLSKSFNFDGREVLLPTVSDDGRLLSDREAIDQYQRTGKHLGVFKDPASADAYAEQLHRSQERRYVR